ncbi:MAG: hypothetical protein WAU32_12535 [Thermoanaerobaculia bacterium]
MRRIGIALLVLGLAGFLIASSQRSGYDSVEGAIKTTFSSEERSKKEGWDTLRWVGLGLAVVGVVMTVAPGRKT